MTTKLSVPERARAPQKSLRGVAVYLAIAFAVAWAVWSACAFIMHKGTPAAALVPIVIAGSFAPFIGSGLAVWRESGARAAVGFYRRGLDWRMGWLVFAVSVFGLPLLAVAVAAVEAAFAGRSLTFQTSWKDIPYVYLWLLILGGALAEEFGWSYLSDRLDEWLAPFYSTLALGVIWALWHLPLFFMAVPGLTQRFIPFGVFVITTVSLRFLMAWCYHRSGRNILSNLLAHNGMNMGLSLVTLVLPVQGTMQWSLLAFAALVGLSATVLFRLAPVGPQAQPDQTETAATADTGVS